MYLNVVMSSFEDRSMVVEAGVVVVALWWCWDWDWDMMAHHLRHHPSVAVDNDTPVEILVADDDGDNAEMIWNVCDSPPFGDVVVVAADCFAANHFPWARQHPQLDIVVALIDPLILHRHHPWQETEPPVRKGVSCHSGEMAWWMGTLASWPFVG